MDIFKVDSVLEEVTVYAKGAVCLRTARVAPSDGAFPRAVEVRGLPLSLNAGSLRARVLDGALARVREVRASFVVHQVDEVDVASEQKALDAAIAVMERTVAQIHLLDRRIAALSTLKPQPFVPKEGEPPEPAPVEAMLAFARFIEADLEGLQLLRLDADRRREDAQQEVELRRKRLAEAGNAQRTQRTRVERTAVVWFADGAPAAEARVAIEYVVPGAMWAPAYELELDPDFQNATLRLRAHVAQRTGEDWNQVRLGLSTAELHRRADIPELKSLRIGRRQPPPRTGWREPPPGLDELFASYDAERARLVPSPPPAIEPVGVTRAGVVKGGAPEVARYFQTAVAAGPPPPGRPPPAAPRMAAPAPAPMAKKVGGAVRSRSARREISADEEAPMELSAAAAPMFDEGFGADALDEAVAPPEPEETATAPEEGLLDYSQLRLAGPQAPSRGRLVRVGVSVTAAVHVQALIDVAVSDARELGLSLPAHAVRVRSAAGAFDYRYDAHSPVDLPSDGTWHMVPVGTAPVALATEFVTVPSVEPKVFRTLRIENRSPHALLPGPADVLVGGGYSMTVPLPLVAPQGTAQVGLGVEEAIKVARNTRYDESSGGLLGGTAVLMHEVRIEVANRLKAPIRLEVRERVPISEDQTIAVKEAEVKPPWKVDKEPRDGVVTLGGRTWRLELPAGAEQELLARYEIRIPANKMLVGGNRRV